MSRNLSRRVTSPQSVAQDFEHRYIHPEECSEFGYTLLNFPWIDRDDLLRRVLWADAVNHWYCDDSVPLDAIQIELILFKEFRYQFNPSWPATKTFEDDVQEYANYARYWATYALWPHRPWRLRNFPVPPRSTISNPYTNESEAAEDQYDYDTYQFRCSRLRAIIKAFPEILRAPSTWRRCVINKKGQMSITEAAMLASQAALTWMAMDGPFEFEIGEGGDEKMDVKLVRKVTVPRTSTTTEVDGYRYRNIIRNEGTPTDV